ncbi:hypothetical protein RRG08_040532 [Elysia crispata]|uniref:Uncharacterized protein n=1 Tax=Elysia crispata TaxID=231223 RepID=A0AAE1D974_9GAST|nr:hypothetical protein RRG08_040532 [Elysia crispata]
MSSRHSRQPAGVSHHNDPLGIRRQGVASYSVTQSLNVPFCFITQASTIVLSDKEAASMTESSQHKRPTKELNSCRNLTKLLRMRAYLLA